MTERYIFETPAYWASSLNDDIILNKVCNTSFSQKQLDEGKDFCYYINHTYFTNDNEFGDYVLMIYTLNQPETLEAASMHELVVEKDEFFKIHRVSVIRNGKLIDKRADLNIKLLDVDSQGNNRILDNTKKISLNIRDLHLGDILVFENTRCRKIKEADFLRKEYDRYIWSVPGYYWAYGENIFRIINQRSKSLVYKKSFFRDDQGIIIPVENGLIRQGEEYSQIWKDYINTTDQSREILPFIDFATELTWEQLSDFISPIYSQVLNNSKLTDFAPDLVTKLASFDNLDDKIQYVIEFVQNSIYYIFNSDEMDGHKPQEASLTYLNKQGDCKAKSVLLKVLLDYIGIESSIILVNFNNDFFLPYYNPSLFIFNHVIVQIRYRDRIFHIDPTQRDQYGRLENRGELYFKNYLEIKENKVLATNQAFEYKKFCLNEKVDIEVIDGLGFIKIESTTRYNRANYIRQYVKRTNRQEVVDHWNQFLFSAMSYNNDRSNEDPRNIFKNAKVDVLHDDKILNEITLVYQAQVESAYCKNKGANLIMYFDASIYKSPIIDYNHKDIPIWQTFDSERYEVSLTTDQKINVNDHYTNKTLNLVNDYYSFSTKKEISKQGVTAIIEYKPKGNIEIPLEDLEHFKTEYQVVSDSNFGVGIEVLQLNVIDKLWRLVK